MTDPVDDARWQRRATRARRLAGERPAVAETLYFYADLAELQADLVRRFPQVIGIPSPSFADRLDAGAALAALPPLLDFIRREAPGGLGAGLTPERDFDRWRHRIHTCWVTGGREAWDANAVQRFVLDALLQPFAELASRGSEVPGFRGSEVPGFRGPEVSGCARCTGSAVVALLRERGHGSGRSLVCGFCAAEWAAPRLTCLGCGESGFESLPVFRSEDFATVRLDACDACHGYTKTIDLTRDGEASPIVDDLASLPLDLWARDQGYRRLRPNLLGV